jgi:uncharacterized membrane protein YhaH (DUF805 family)
MTLILVNLIAFGTLAIKQLRARRWIGYAALTALPVAVIEMVVEDWRWQMIPAYALTAIFLVIWLLNKEITGGLRVNRAISILGAGLGVIAIALSILAGCTA